MAAKVPIMNRKKIVFTKLKDFQLVNCVLDVMTLVLRRSFSYKVRKSLTEGEETNQS